MSDEIEKKPGRWDIDSRPLAKATAELLAAKREAIGSLRASLLEALQTLVIDPDIELMLAKTENEDVRINDANIEELLRLYVEATNNVFKGEDGLDVADPRTTISGVARASTLSELLQLVQTENIELLSARISALMEIVRGSKTHDEIAAILDPQLRNVFFRVLAGGTAERKAANFIERIEFLIKDDVFKAALIVVILRLMAFYENQKSGISQYKTAQRRTEAYDGLADRMNEFGHRMADKIDDNEARAEYRANEVRRVAHFLLLTDRLPATIRSFLESGLRIGKYDLSLGNKRRIKEDQPVLRARGITRMTALETYNYYLELENMWKRVLAEDQDVFNQAEALQRLQDVQSRRLAASAEMSQQRIAHELLTRSRSLAVRTVGANEISAEFALGQSALEFAYLADVAFGILAAYNAAQLTYRAIGKMKGPGSSGVILELIRSSLDELAALADSRHDQEVIRQLQAALSQSSRLISPQQSGDEAEIGQFVAIDHAEDLDNVYEGLDEDDDLELRG